ncbi:Luc7-like protein 3 [Sparganum proliferum]
MALASQAALLDELMGKNRNACGPEGLKTPHWSDEDMCKSFLCGFCPHDLFVNTKTDLGPCDKTHDERMVEMYKKSSRYGKMGYEEEFYRYLCYLLEDVDKRIRRGHDRLNVSKSVNPADPDAAAEKKEKIESITRRINDLVEQAEKLGTEGKVDQAQGVLKLCEQLKFERSQLEGDVRPGVGQAKELEVCEICGAFRIKDDAPQRVEEHLSGKMHLGYAKIRDYVREYGEKRLLATKERERDSRASDRGASRHRDRHRSRDRSRDRRI